MRDRHKDFVNKLNIDNEVNDANCWYDQIKLWSSIEEQNYEDIKKKLQRQYNELFG